MRSLSVSLTLTAVACLAGCVTQSPAEQPVSLSFALVAGEQPVRCGSPFGAGITFRKRFIGKQQTNPDTMPDIDLLSQINQIAVGPFG